MSFYVYLPSNSSSTFFPKNAISNFHAKLARNLTLGHNEYEVALTEFSYVHKFAQFTSDYDRTIVIRFKENPNDISVHTISATIDDKRYRNIIKLLEEINSKIPKLAGGFMTNIHIYI